MRLLKISLILFGPLAVQYFFTAQSNFTYSLFVTALLLWFTEIIPLAVTGLLIPTIAVILGLVDSKTSFSAFGNQIIFLFIGSFILAKAFAYHKLDHRIAYFILSQKLATRSLYHLQFFISLICWILSMWISNTASTALMAPLCIGMASSLKERFEQENDYKNFMKSLLFLCAFSSSIGGMATPVGSPPNVLAMEFLAQKSIHLTFFDWMIMGLPISFVMLILLNLLMLKLYPLTKVKVSGLREFALEKKKQLGPLTTGQKQVMFCFMLALTLWIGPGILKLFDSTMAYSSFLSSHLPIGVVALVASATLFLLPLNNETNMDWEKAKDIDWGTILLFGGGLSLGTILNKTGTANIIGDVVFQSIQAEYLLLLIVTVAFGVIMSEFSSNTASASIIIPLVLGGISALTPSQTTSIIVATAFGASFGFMLPVSTPPNAIIYGTRKLKLKEMIKTGLLFDVLGLLTIFLLVGLLYPLF
ncbi:MAG: SLC13 family permease [Bacteriovoracaceae bacterium]